jgi:cellobiose transport system substrate-binding protein
MTFAVVAALATGLLAGCATDDDSGSDGGSGGGAGNKGGTTVTIGTFGVFGYKQAGLYDEYMKLHPGVTIKENVTTRTDVYWPKTLTRLQAGSGTDDIQAIEVGNITEAVQTQADKFVDLGKEVDKSQWLDWKNAQATTKDGKLIGLGTDVGPMAICYRKDLFEKAGLETDRAVAGRLEQVRRPRQAVHEEGAERHQVRGLRVLRLQRGARRREGAVLRQGRQRHLGQVHGGEEVLERRHGGGDEQHVGQAEAVRQAVGPGLRQRHLRHGGLPRVDARLHPGEVR